MAINKLGSKKSKAEIIDKVTVAIKGVIKKDSKSDDHWLKGVSSKRSGNLIVSPDLCFLS